MKKSTIMLVTVLFMIIGYAAYNATVNIYGLGKISENISDFKVYLDNLKVNDKENTGINSAKDEFTIDNIDGNISIDIVNDSTEYDTESYLECESNVTPDKTEWIFDYTGGEQTFTAPMSGTYKLETWGAQGGVIDSTYFGGYGGYSSGTTTLNKDDVLYINVGGSGKANNGTSDKNLVNGGYNGGGHSKRSADTSGRVSSGGGATHIATSSGLLTTFENSLENLIIVSGGGGGCSNHGGWNGKGGHAGGYIGVSAYDCHDAYNGKKGYVCGVGGTQTESYNSLDTSGKYNGSFGTGVTSITTGKIGGGGGFFGGTSGTLQGAGGGSSYIGNPILTEKAMYCYNCIESSEESTKTISTTCISETPTENCAKEGNGYARITLVLNDKDSKISTDPIIVEAQDNETITLENINMENFTCKLKVNKISRTEKAYTGPTEWTFDYTGSEQTFIAPVSGTYKLETWGAQGYTINSYTGGYGGYSTGIISFLKNDNIYIFVGEKGKGGIGNGTKYSSYPNSLNAVARDNVSYTGSGGGSTHIALENALINKITDLNNLIMVSGGGGASTWTSGNSWAGTGGSGGGFKGNSGKSNIAKYTPGGGGTQNSGGSAGNVGTAGNFGLSEATSLYETVGGGGYYGGGTSWGSAGGGGSGYIGNSKLSEKVMYCYNCATSTEESTKTISTTCTSATPTANCSKQGNGYARITLIK